MTRSGSFLASRFGGFNRSGSVVLVVLDGTIQFSRFDRIGWVAQVRARRVGLVGSGCSGQAGRVGWVSRTIEWVCSGRKGIALLRYVGLWH